MPRIMRARTTVPERVMLYEESKRIYDGLPIKPDATELYRQAKKVLPSAKREPSKSYAPIIYCYVRGDEVKKLGSGKALNWTPPEWSILLAEFDRQLGLGKKKSQALLMAQQLLPQSRRRKMVSILPNEVHKVLVNYKKLKPATVSEPFRTNPPPAAEQAPKSQESKTASEQPPVDDEALTNLGGMVFNLLGTAFNSAIERAATIIGDRLGERIGTTVAKSVGDALYEMRMGMLSSSRVATQAAATADTDSVAAIQARRVLAGQNPEQVRKKKVCVVGLEPGREHLLQHDNPHLDFRFPPKHLPGGQIRDVADNCDATYVAIKFVAHAVTDALKKPAGPGFSACNGIDALRHRIKTDFPTPPQSPQYPGGNGRQHAAH